MRRRLVLVSLHAMKHPDKSWRGLKPSQRLGIGFIGLMIIATGALTLVQGKLHYFNAWGLAVFAPFAFVVGILTIVIAIRFGPRQ
jgi:hypothetical protein